MRKRKLGRTNLMVSEVSLGCSGYWGNRRFDESIAISLVREAFERGINFFDTGHNYSGFNAEPRLGLAIKEILAQHDRSSLVISSKGGSLLGSASLLPLDQRVSQNFSANAIEASCRRSIENLNCGYLDIFQLHGIKAFSLTDSLLDRLMEMREKGMFRVLGINTHDSEMMRMIAAHPDLCEMVLIDYNVLQLDREPLIEALVAKGVGVVAGTILAQGHLVRGKIGSIRSGSFFGI